MKSKRIRDKICNRDAAAATVKDWKENGRTVVFTNGCFDILHRGHVSYLADAAELGDKLIIGLNSDQSVTRLKGQDRPIQDEDSRALILASLEVVDMVVLFEEDTPAELITSVLPDVLVKGGDYTIDQIAGAQEVMQSGGKVITIPIVEGYSTTSIEKKLKS